MGQIESHRARNRIPEPHPVRVLLRSGRRGLTPLATVVVDHRVGMCAQELGRGRVPRLSIGTLQLSIRCSSIHFRPSRSFPVSVPDEAAGFGGGWPIRAFWASAGSMRQIAKSAAGILNNERMNRLAKLGCLVAAETWERPIKQ